MPFSNKSLGRHRFEFSGKLTSEEIDGLAANPDVHTLQCSSPVEAPTWDRLNETYFPRRPEVQLRVYGSYSSTCDLSFVTRLQNVRRFSADCLTKAEGVEHLSALVQLEELAIGIYSLENFDFLKTIPSGMKTLSLGPTKSKKPRLDPLVRFQSLRKLFIGGQQQGIEVIAGLNSLEDLTLGSISTPNVEYVSKLPRLWSLRITLGGIKGLSAIQGNEGLKFLELWRVKNLSDISVISSLSGLQFLSLRELRNVKSIPDLSKLTKLRRLWLENMKGLEDVSAIRLAPNLEQFSHIAAQNIPPEKYEDLLHKPSLQQLLVGFGSQKRNKEFEDLIERSGKSIYHRAPFVFQ